MLASSDYSISFSCVKTAVLYKVRNLKKNGQYSDQVRDHLCAAFQRSVVSVLVHKTISAAKEYQAPTVLVGGGVAANASLRAALASAVSAHTPHVALNIAPREYCTDNAVMIAVAAFFRMRKKRDYSPLQCAVDPLWDITDE
jgi:N6-L-threonylcarbamoyladenine synthase